MNDKAQLSQLGKAQQTTKELHTESKGKKPNKWASRKLLAFIVSVGLVYGASLVVTDSVVYAAMCGAVTTLYGVYVTGNIKDIFK